MSFTLLDRFAFTDNSFYQNLIVPVEAVLPLYHLPVLFPIIIIDAIAILHFTFL